MMVPRYPNVEMYIDGAWRSGETVPVTNPFDGAVIGSRAHATTRDLEDAVSAAVKGQRAWGQFTPARRESILAEAAGLLRVRADEIAPRITLDEGKTLAEARAEVIRAAETLEWDAHESRRLYGRVIPAAPGLQVSTSRHPVGVVAAFTPWNFPISTPSRKFGGALAAGCSVVMKGAEDAPSGACAMVQALVDAGVPDGAVNLVFGNPPSVAEFLVSHLDVRLVTLTGSLAVGRDLASLAGRHMKPAVMELGGHAPVIVAEDVDLQNFVTSLLAIKALNAGQVCISPTRVFVVGKAYDEVVPMLAAGAAGLVVGNGLAEGTQMGPLVNNRRREAVQALIDDAAGCGAEIVVGGQPKEGPGLLFPLTVLTDVPSQARVMSEEPFGPVLIVNQVSSVEEAVNRANEVRYGLAGYAFTNSARDVRLLTESLNVGNLGINHFGSSLPETPFGGVGDSGYGREGGVEGIESYTVVKTVMALT